MDTIKEINRGIDLLHKYNVWIKRNEATELLICECVNCGENFYKDTKEVLRKYCRKCSSSVKYFHKRKPQKVIACAECGKKFMSSRKSNKYCSKECGKLVKNKRIADYKRVDVCVVRFGICIQCGKSFLAHGGGIKKKKYCSKECQKKNYIRPKNGVRYKRKPFSERKHSGVSIRTKKYKSKCYTYYEARICEKYKETLLYGGKDLFEAWCCRKSAEAKLDRGEKLA